MVPFPANQFQTDTDALIAVADGESKPTPRAIKERITKIKELSRNAATGTSGTTGPNTPKKSTPRKKPAAKAAIFETPRKRKRPSKAQQDAAAKRAAFEQDENQPINLDDSDNEKESIEIDETDDEEAPHTGSKREKLEDKKAELIKLEDSDTQEVNFKPKKSDEEEEVLFADSPKFSTSSKLKDQDDEVLFDDAPKVVIRSDNRYGQIDSRLRQTSTNPTLSQEFPNDKDGDWYPNEDAYA